MFHLQYIRMSSRKITITLSIVSEKIWFINLDNTAPNPNSIKVCTNYLVPNVVKISWPSLTLMRLYTFRRSNLVKLQALYNLSSVRYKRIGKGLVVVDGSHRDLTFWV